MATGKRFFGGADGATLPAYIGALLGGALLGGVALALLNRKTIQELREKLERDSPADDVY